MKKCVIYNNIAIPTNNKSPGICKPRECPLNFIAAFVTPQFTAIMVSLFLVIIPVRANQLDAPIRQTFAERIAAVAFVGYQPFGILPRTASALARYGDGFERFLIKALEGKGVWMF
jgi:hypothetical protein